MSTHHFCSIALVAVLALSGCGSGKAEKRAAPAPLAKPFAPALTAPMKLYNTATLDGQQLVLLSSTTNYLEYTGYSAYNNQRVFQLVNGAGKVLLPLSPDEVRLVPSRGVYVLPAEDRLRYRREAFQKAVRDSFHGQATYLEDQGTGRMVERPIRYWQKLDLASGRLSPTNILHIEADFGDRANDTSLAEKLREPSHLIVSWDQQMIAEIISPAGDLLGKYDRYDPPATTSWLLGGGRFSVIRYWSGNDPVDQLLGRLLEPLATPAKQVVEVQSRFKKKYLVTPAPGTGVDQDLWLVMQPDGRFLAPPGAIGVRPVNNHTDPTTATQSLQTGASRLVECWLVRYPAPGEPGYPGNAAAQADPVRWGWCKSDFTYQSGPMWNEAQVIITKQSGWEPAHWLTLRRGGQWETFTIFADPLIASSQQAKGATAAEAIARSDEKLAATRAAQVKAQTAADKAFLAAQPAIRAEADWQEAVRNNNYNAMGYMIHSRSADDWYRYARYMPNASSWLLNQAADKMTDPAKAAELRQRAAQRAAEATAEFNRYHRAQAAPPAPSQTYSGSTWTMPTQSMQFSNPQIYNYRVQTYGSFQPMPWDPK